MINRIQNKSAILFAITSICFVSFSNKIFLQSESFLKTVAPAKAEIKTEIPKDFDLFCPINKNAKRDENGKFPTNTEKWYSEINGQTQIFRLFKGDSIARGFDAKNFHSNRFNLEALCHKIYATGCCREGF